MEDSKSTEPSQSSIPLLEGAQVHGINYDEQVQSETCSIPAILILSTLVAVCGSYVFGSAVSSHLHFLV